VTAWTSDRRVIALVGGTGAGKTWFAPRLIYKWLTAHPGTRCLCIGLGYEKHVDRVMIREVRQMLDGLKVRYNFLRKNGLIELPNGSAFLFGSAENPLSLEGAHLEYCWIDEAGMMGITTFEVAQRRTGMASGSGMGQILITTIPYFEGWLRREVYDLYMKGDPSIEWIPCTSKDNPGYPRDEIERMKRKNYTRYLIYYEGKWAKMEGLIFPDPPDEDIVVDPFVIPKAWPCYSGHDFGWNAPTTGVWGRLDPVNDILYLVAEYEEVGQTIEDHLWNWRDMGLTFIDEAWGDPANPEIWERCAEAGFPVTPAVNRMSFTLDCVSDRLLTGRLKVFRGCKKWLDHRNTYRWATANDDEETMLDKPKKPQSAEHMMDATRYLCAGLAISGISTPPDPLIAARWKTIGGRNSSR
jgi:Phage terminase large subunit